MAKPESWLSYHRDAFIAGIFSLIITLSLVLEARTSLQVGHFGTSESAGYGEAVFVSALAASAAVLGIVLAGVAVVIAFVHPGDLAEAYKQSRKAFERYIAVFFAPAKVAIATIPIALVCRAIGYVVSSNPTAVVVATAPTLAVLAYQLAALWQTVDQVSGALRTVASNPEPPSGSRR